MPGTDEHAGRGEPADPVEDDPGTWQCCKCDSLCDDDSVLELEWDGKTVNACPKCGHAMTWECCGPPGID